MNRVFRVAFREYNYNLRRPAFLFTAFGTPLMIVGIWVLIFTVFDNTGPDFSEFDTVGYVDNAAIIVEDSLNTDDDPDFVFQPYENEASANSALESEALDAYFVIPADYITAGTVQRYANGDVPEDLNSTFQQLIAQNISQDLEVGFPAERLVEPFSDMTVFLQDTGRELSSEAVPVLLLTPMFFAILFWLVIQTTSTFMMTSLVQEKSNRILEVLVTSITPLQMIGGKIIGLGLLGLTQIIVWLVLALLFFIVGPSTDALSFLEGFSIPFDLFLAGIVYFLLGYFLIAALLAGIGVLVGTEQQSNQYAAIVNLIGYFIPLAFFTTFIETPDAAIPTILSILPLTAPFSMVLRVGFGAVPAWQLALSIGVQIVIILIVTYASAKIFRWGMLMYGKQFTLRDITDVIFGNREMGVTNEQLERDTGDTMKEATAQ